MAEVQGPHGPYSRLQDTHDQRVAAQAAPDASRLRLVTPPVPTTKGPDAAGLIRQSSNGPTGLQVAGLVTEGVVLAAELGIGIPHRDQIRKGAANVWNNVFGSPTSTDVSKNTQSTATPKAQATENPTQTAEQQRAQQLDALSKAWDSADPNAIKVYESKYGPLQWGQLYDPDPNHNTQVQVGQVAVYGQFGTLVGVPLKAYETSDGQVVVTVGVIRNGQRTKININLDKLYFGVVENNPGNRNIGGGGSPYFTDKAGNTYTPTAQQVIDAINGSILKNGAPVDQIDLNLKDPNNQVGVNYLSGESTSQPSSLQSDQTDPSQMLHAWDITLGA